MSKTETENSGDLSLKNPIKSEPIESEMEEQSGKDSKRVKVEEEEKSGEEKKEKAEEVNDGYAIRAAWIIHGGSD